MKKILKLLLSLMVFSALLPAATMQAQAGVISRFIEVDENDRKQAEADRIRAQEEYKQEAKAQIEKEVIKPIAKKAPEVKQQVITKKEPVNLAPKGKHSNDLICKIVGTIVALPVGAISGLVRGSVSKGGELAGSFSDSMDSNLAGNLVGKPSGVIVGGVSGALAGLLNGAVTGIRTGWSDPFTKESFSLDGQTRDYDPFNF
ncbi:MAG: hypothetical protein O3C63_01170 [Cyanobacteria bacterium]|nr:hypothetical protein [Cyanobacteriota bacterium]MDA1021108.1 hypothetical protein [Cyanobacteriota bacterium]